MLRLVIQNQPHRSGTNLKSWSLRQTRGGSLDDSRNGVMKKLEMKTRRF